MQRQLWFNVWMRFAVAVAQHAHIRRTESDKCTRKWTTAFAWGGFRCFWYFLWIMLEFFILWKKSIRNHFSSINGDYSILFVIVSSVNGWFFKSQFSLDKSVDIKIYGYALSSICPNIDTYVLIHTYCTIIFIYLLFYMIKNWPIKFNLFFL